MRSIDPPTRVIGRSPDRAGFSPVEGPYLDDGLGERAVWYVWRRPGDIGAADAERPPCPRGGHSGDDGGDDFARLLDLSGQPRAGRTIQSTLVLYRDRGGGRGSSVAGALQPRESRHGRRFAGCRLFLC